MDIKVKLNFEEEVSIKLEDFCNEETIIYKYSDKQLKEIYKILIEKIDDKNIPLEKINEYKNALIIIKNVLYIINKINIKKINKDYLKNLSNNNLINLRNDIIKIFNKHIILYKETMLPLYSKMIDISSLCLLEIKNELESRNLNIEMTKQEEIELYSSLNKWKHIHL